MASKRYNGGKRSLGLLSMMICNNPRDYLLILLLVSFYEMTVSQETSKQEDQK
jgi:hypothetical protein